MEWKEHAAWLAPIAVTMVAYVTAKYGRTLVRPRQLRTAVLAFVIVAFAATGVPVASAPSSTSTHPSAAARASSFSAPNHPREIEP
jgi:hypothetical protein